ncbi:hypothetical protein D3C85_441010 [compost metagenome]
MYALALALALSVSTTHSIPTTDHSAKSAQYGTQTESVILRNWVLPVIREYAPTNTVAPVNAISAIAYMRMLAPVRIGRVEGCIIG